MRTCKTNELQMTSNNDKWNGNHESDGKECAQKEAGVRLLRKVSVQEI